MVRTRTTPAGSSTGPNATNPPTETNLAVPHAAVPVAMAPLTRARSNVVGATTSNANNGSAEELKLMEDVASVAPGTNGTAGQMNLMQTYMVLPVASSTSSGVSASPAAGVSSGVPRRFPPFRESYGDMSELRRELKVISVQRNAPYYMQHSSPQRLEARCPTWKQRKTVPTTCEYVVSANRHTNGRVYITRAVLTHAPSCPIALASADGSKSNISAAALMETAKPFMAKISDSVKPKDMANIMKEQFGVTTSYMTAWRALSAFRQQKKNEESASYMKIRGYLEAIVHANEGTVVAFEHAPGTTIFARAFLCPKPLQTALLYCRSAVLFSVYLITSAYGGVVMMAMAQDAMGENVPLAIGIAPTESEGNWLFFLQQLQHAIPDFERSVMTLVHNRGEELQHALHATFPNCVQSDNVDAFASGSGATSSPTPLPATDSSFQWIEILCTKSPLMILVGWVSKVASTLFQRYEKYGHIKSEYPAEFHALLMQYEAEADHYEVLRIAENGYEVIDQHTGRQRIVDFTKQTCTCGEYAVSRFPCLHVFLAISYAGLLRTDVIPRIFLMTSLKDLYGGRLTPIDVETVASDQITTPNPQPRARGRPRKIHQIQQFGDIKQERLSCSICGVKGHNKRTCKRILGGGTGGNTTQGAMASSMNAVDSEDPDDTEPTFLDTTYEDELPFENPGLAGSGDQSLPMGPSAATKHVPAGQAEANMTPTQEDEDKSGGSPSSKRRKVFVPKSPKHVAEAGTRNSTGGEESTV